MGWGRTLLLGDIGNRLDIEDTERDIAELQRRLAKARAERSSLEARVENLEAERDELELYLASLVRLLVRRGTVSQREVEALVRGIEGQGQGGT